VRGFYLRPIDTARLGRLQSDLELSQLCGSPARCRSWCHADRSIPMHSMRLTIRSPHGRRLCHPRFRVCAIAKFVRTATACSWTQRRTSRSHTGTRVSRMAHFLATNPLLLKLQGKPSKRSW